MNSTTETSAHDRILAERSRYVSAGVSTPRLVVSHADGARVTDVDGRIVHRLRRRHRLPEHRPPLCARRRRDQGAGRRLPPPVLHGRRLRALRRGVPPPGRAVAVRRGGAEVDAPQLGGRGGRERRQDRALGDRPAGRRRLRQRLPRPDAADDDDDREGEAVQGGLRPVRARRSTARPCRTPTAGSRPTMRSPG